MLTAYDAGYVAGLREAAKTARELRVGCLEDRAKERHQRRMATRILQAVNDLIMEAGGDPIDDE